MHRRTFLALGAGMGAGLIAGCTGNDESTPNPEHGGRLVLATTTSTYDTGLLGELNDAFADRFDASVETVAQGTGAALETARTGDADVVLVHARSLEDKFLADGYGINRRDVMINDFVIVGPPGDPAGIGAATTAPDALRTVAETESTFVSRGDDSGTHRRERELWTEAGIDPDGEWYREVGSGMGSTLHHAHLADSAYTLSDRGTFLAMRAELDLDVHLDGPIGGGPEGLANPYGIMAVNPGRHAHVAYELAMAYIGYVTGPDGQDRIAEYTVDGEQVFYATAITDEPPLDQHVLSAWTTEEA